MRLIKTICLFTLSAILLAGCVKSKNINFASQASPSPNIVGFPNQSQAAAFNIVATPTTYTFYVEASSQDNNLPAATVTIAKDVALVTNAGFEFLPDSAYQLVNTTATVDPSTHLAAFELKINTTKIDLSHSFAVGYTIASTTGGVEVASNKKSDIISVLAKNKWDGDYHSNGYFYHPSSPRAINNLAKTLSTAGANTVKMNLGDLGNVVIVTIDDATNTITSISDDGPGPGIQPTHTLATLAAGSPPTYTAKWAGSSQCNNTYDPATKTFYLRYGYVGGTGYRISEEILTHD
jgi:hypothetical protein